MNESIQWLTQHGYKVVFEPTWKNPAGKFFQIDCRVTGPSKTQTRATPCVSAESVTVHTMTGLEHDDGYALETIGAHLRNLVAGLR